MKIIGEIQKNSAEKIIASLDTFKGRKIASLRVFYLDGTEYKPGPKGLTIRRELLPEILKLVTELDSESKKEEAG